MTDEKYKRTRSHGTRWSVHAADKISTACITVGGIGTILAVSAVFLFLVVVVVPLFVPGNEHEAGSVKLPAVDARIVRVAVDEDQLMGWLLTTDGDLRVFRLSDGAILEEDRIANGDSVTAWSSPTPSGQIAMAFLDGSFQLGQIEIATDFPSGSDVPPGATQLEEGATMIVGNALVEKTGEDRIRRHRVEVTLSSPVTGISPSPIRLIDRVGSGDRSVVCTYSDDGQLRIRRVEQTENLLTGDVEYDITGGEVATGVSDTRAVPLSLVVAESGTAVYLLWADGKLIKYDTRDISSPVRAGVASIIGDSNRLTAFETLLGGATFLTGGDNGDVRAWFEVRAQGDDEFVMADAHKFDVPGAAVTAIAPSSRSRIFAVGQANGRVHVFQATSQAKVLDFGVEGDESILDLALTPRNDGLIVLTDKAIHHYQIDVGYPEATLAALFTPVWYEGYPAPANVWQSSSGTDDFEPKLGMWPLIFGTLKATLYSMLFGIPLALLAAIFTSEFLSPNLKPRVKTLIESMASLPSVVLGFLAALVFAPFVQRVVASTMVGFVLVPATFLLGAYAWQLLPQYTSLRLARFRLLVILAILPVGIWLSGVIGPLVERLLFAGDMVLWLDGQRGSGAGGWVMLLLPLSAVAVLLSMDRYVAPKFRKFASFADRRSVALADLVRFLVGAALTLLVAFGLAGILNALGIDPRGGHSFLDTYVQRNALVVGFVMGFAIIPIIYTIAEDALSAVPDHLRAASLGAGATPWQTATRIVVPTAMSGLFSAIMIGLGRAVGETMIVLMAAGNTPVMELNIFNGFRTLSANIAVELPEAVRDSTHYRTLFLAALILFIMTFTINTVAELVRLRFRKRSAQI